MINFKLVNDKCMPHVGSEEAAGIDLRVDAEAQFIEAGKEYHFGLGVHAQIPKGWCGLVVPRSGLGVKYKLRLDNTIGVIDSDYRGMIQLFCTFEKSFWLEEYERICQMVVVPHYATDFAIVEELSSTARGEGGFGHSGRT